MSNGDFHGGGVSDTHALWAVAAMVLGFIFKSNGWAETVEVKDVDTGAVIGRRLVMHWKTFFSDWTSAGMILVLALGATAIWPLVWGAPLPAAGTALFVATLFLIGLRPLTERIYALLDALIVRAKGGCAA